MGHPISIRGYETLEELAKDISHLRYDAMVRVISYLSDKLESNAESDFGIKRFKLASEGYRAANSARELASHIEKMMITSRKYMKKELEENPEMM